MVVRSDCLLVMITWVKWSPGVILNGFGVFEGFGISCCMWWGNSIKGMSTYHWRFRRAVRVRRVVVVASESFMAAGCIRCLGFYWRGFWRSI